MNQNTLAKLSRLYANALLAPQPPLGVAAVAMHTAHFIENGRLTIPEGLGTMDYTDLKEGVLLLIRNPDLRVQWVEDGQHGARFA